MLLNHNVRRTHQTCAIRRLSRQVRLRLQSHRLQQEPVRRLRFRQLLLRLASRPRQACRGRSTSSGLPWQAPPSGVLARGILNTQRPKGGLCHPTTTASTSTRTSPSASVSSTSRPRHAGRGKLLNPATPSCRHPDKLTLPSPGSGASSNSWPSSATLLSLGRVRGDAPPCSAPTSLGRHWLWWRAASALFWSDESAPSLAVVGERSPWPHCPGRTLAMTREGPIYGERSDPRSYTASTRGDVLHSRVLSYTTQRLPPVCIQLLTGGAQSVVDDSARERMRSRRVGAV